MKRTVWRVCCHKVNKDSGVTAERQRCCRGPRGYAAATTAGGGVGSAKVRGRGPEVTGLRSGGVGSAKLRGPWAGGYGPEVRQRGLG